jgi:hypothetical protein
MQDIDFYVQQKAPREAEATSLLGNELTEAIIRYFESRTAPEGQMEIVAVFVLADLLAAIVSDRDDVEELARTVYDRILSDKSNTLSAADRQ